MRAGFEIIEHPADVGFLAWGATRKELYQNAALAMLSLACEPDSIKERIRRRVGAAGADAESLLYAWLAEILAIADAEQLVFRRVEVTALDEQHVRGTAHGEKFDKTRHRAGTYIKAVTLHQFGIEKTADGWRATVYLDV